ncbi:MAG TPA: hydantoinase/oxoprolinase family protein [Acidimicrobiales bacterium]|nr:hydantoinase/oxoprolinase family protein [Acidimicrobiales bacterium]
MTPTEGDGWWVGVDVGGTFTDVVAVDAGTGEIRTGKVLSRKGAQEEGVQEAIEHLGVPFDRIRQVVHGHTVGINTILNRSGGKTALLATDGHRDLLDIGRLQRYRPRMYDPTWVRPHQERPLVARQYRFPIRERLLADGSEHLALDDDAVRAAGRRMRQEGIDACGICFINGYRNSAHEDRAVELLHEVHPDLYVQTSAVYPVTREHERTTTVVIDAYVGGVVSRYLERLRTALSARGFDGPIWIMMMNGGVQTLDEAKRSAVFQVQSGPTGGVSAALRVARTSPYRNLLTMDVGGTSTDVACIRDAGIPLTDLWAVEWGLSLTMPLVDVRSIGSGAGSVVTLDNGSLRVGPDSAGSDPGPACYGRGGHRPTLTDACVQLGLLQPDQFAGGAIPLDPAAATAALQSVAGPLAMTPTQLADGAVGLACAEIADSIRAISTYRGLDLREFALLAFGAAGPMLAGLVARELEMATVLIPPAPGQFSAFGMLASELRVTTARSPMVTLGTDVLPELDRQFRGLEADLGARLARQGARATTFERSVYVMYRGQTWDNRIAVTTADLLPERLPDLQARIHDHYQRTYGYSAAELPIIVTKIEVNGVGDRAALPTLDPHRSAGDGAAEGDALLKTAQCTLDGAVYDDVPFYRRLALVPGEKVSGLAVVVDPYSTIVVPPEATAVSEPDGYLRLSL